MKLKHYLTLALLILVTFVQAYYFGQNKVNAKIEEWSTIQTMHFDIYFPQGEDEFGKLAALMAEESYYYLKEQLKFPITSRIPIIFYRSKAAFQNTNIIYPLLTEEVSGFTESLHNRVVIPFDGSYANLEELLIHELTHAYLNALERAKEESLASLYSSYIPFWFSEGLPEYFSTLGKKDYNNMFILDMVINDKLPYIENTSGYYAYRLGESFLTFIAETYGPDKLMEYFFALRSTSGIDYATKKIFGLDFKELESRWRFQLKREFLPLIETHDLPSLSLEQRTNSKRDGSYFNLMPRFSPQGDKYVYFSTAGARYSIWMGGLHGLSAPERIIKGEVSGKMEEFYYFRSSLSWFPDNTRIAFSAKTSDGDCIYIVNTSKKKIVQTIKLKDFDAIYELDVAPDGKSIVFAGQKNMQCDLYLYNLETKELQQLTDDYYNDLQPRFAPDGNSIVFASERSQKEPEFPNRLFSHLNQNIFHLNLNNGICTQLTLETKDCGYPSLDASGTKLYFVSSIDGVSNLFMLNLTSAQKAKVTNVLAGVYSADISPNGKQIVLSNYFQDAWNIYFTEIQTENLSFIDYYPPQFVKLKNDLLETVDLSRLNYYGKRPQRPYMQKDPLIESAHSNEEMGSSDSLRMYRNLSYDDKPITIETIPEIKPYKTKFSLDTLWGGLAYSSYAGTVGYLELSLSDIMGNHGIGISLSAAGKLKDSNLLISYLYLKQRMDYGIGLFNLNDLINIQMSIPGPQNDLYIRYKQRQTGLYLLLRYPFNRFTRIELENMFYQQEYYLSYWDWNIGDWTEEENLGSDKVFSPAVNLVHDNALYGPTGPLAGRRLYYSVGTSLRDNNLDYLTNYLDWRNYILFSKRYSLATRLITGISVGDYPQRFALGGYYGIRAYDGNLSGEKKAVFCTELRFPFFENINIAFPLPLNIPNVRGSLFAEIGTVFDDFNKFQATHEGKLKDLYLGYGFGPRINLGIFILSLDITWLTDLSHISKPTYYLSLSEDF
ncbi:MAG TPA: hypothetical protein PK015_02900 [Candidatus Syntrophosphaera thermopropionivorans]|nr:hypothetical protein [Candidatus Syntrophosphaera thermopropionivorans]